MAVKDTDEMIAGMAPERDTESWYFCTTMDRAQADKAIPHAICTFAEAEGTSLILPEIAARDLGFVLDLPMTRITLSVHSALDGVGLTAAVATALAEARIPCNMVAAYHHDHAFVPEGQAAQAMSILEKLAKAAA